MCSIASLQRGYKKRGERLMCCNILLRAYDLQINFSITKLLQENKMNDETINDKDANIPIMIFKIYVTIHVRLLFCVLHFYFGKTPKTQYKVKYYAYPCYHVLNN